MCLLYELSNHYSMLGNQIYQLTKFLLYRDSYLGSRNQILNSRVSAFNLYWILTIFFLSHYMLGFFCYNKEESIIEKTSRQSFSNLLSHKQFPFCETNCSEKYIIRSKLFLNISEQMIEQIRHDNVQDKKQCLRKENRGILWVLLFYIS